MRKGKGKRERERACVKMRRGRIYYIRRERGREGGGEMEAKLNGAGDDGRQLTVPVSKEHLMSK